MQTRVKEQQLEDVTLAMRKIISCVLQMHQAFNREIIIATLKGKKTPVLFHLELHKLAAYGSLVNYAENQIAYLIQVLFDEGALKETNGKYQAVKLAAGARMVLAAQSGYFVRMPARQKQEQKSMVENIKRKEEQV